MSDIESGSLSIFRVFFWGVVRLLFIALPIALITVMLVPPQRLHEIAEADRTMQYWEGFPLTLVAWWHQPHRLEVPPVAPIEQTKGDKGGTATEISHGVTEQVGDLLGYKELGTQSEQYWAIIGARWLVLGPWLPGCIMAYLVAWWWGRAQNYDRMRKGWSPAPHHFRWGRYTIDMSLGLIIAWTVVPMSLPAVIVLIPTALGLFAAKHTGLHKG